MPPAAKAQAMPEPHPATKAVADMHATTKDMPSATEMHSAPTEMPSATEMHPPAVATTAMAGIGRR